MNTSTIDIDEMIGRLSAPIGSKPWAVAVKEEMRNLLREHDGAHKSLRGYLDVFIQHEGWKLLDGPNGRPFATYTDFCREPQPLGLGRGPEEIEQVIKERMERQTAKALAADPEVKPAAEHGGKREEEEDSIGILTPGNSATYLVRRLKRDSPEIAEALARGEYPSARAAGIAAGIVKVPTPMQIARRAILKMSRAEQNELLSWLAEMLGV